jgi:hypothetical protein
LFFLLLTGTTVSEPQGRQNGLSATAHGATAVAVKTTRLTQSDNFELSKAKVLAHTGIC